MANNYKIKMKDIQNKYKFKIFCAGYEYDDTEIKSDIASLQNDVSGLQTSVSQKANITESGRYIDLELNTSTYVLTAKLKDKNNNLISTSTQIDLPLETMIVDAEYDSENKAIILTLQNGNTLSVPIGDLISGLVTQDDLDEVVDELDATKEELDQYKTIYNILPKVEGNGESITLNNTGESILKLDTRGQCKQDSTTGKNLFNINATKSDGSATSTITDNTLKIVTSGAYGRTDYLNIAVPQSAYKLTFSWNSTTSISGTDARVYVYDGAEVGEMLTYSNLTGTSGNVELTFTNTTGKISLRFSPNNTATAQTITMNFTNIMISTSGGEYEPYTGENASPNPSYPQDVRVVSGNNTIKVIGKNLASDRYEDYIMYDAAYAVFPVQLEQGATYVISATRVGEAKPNYYNYGIVKDGDTYAEFVGLSTIVEYASGDAKAPMRYTIDNTWVNPKLVCYLGNSNQETKFNELFNNFHIQLEKSNTKNDYVPYERTDYDVDLGVVNLFDKNNVNIINTYLINDGDGTLPSDGGERNNCAYIPCKSNTTYTIQKMEGKRFKVGYTYSTPTIGGNVYGKTGANNDTQITITTNSQAQYLIVYLRNGNVSGEITLEQALNSLQIEEGSKANSYTPYGLEPIKMRGIGTYEDYFVRNSEGQWCKYNAIGNVVLDGSEEYSYSAGYKNTLLKNIGMIATNVQLTGFLYCNYFTEKGNTEADNFDYAISRFYATSSYNYEKLVFKDKNMTSANDFKTWLSTHNTEVDYVLASPYLSLIESETLQSQLDAIEKALGKDGQTNISQVNNDAPFKIYASALEKISNS